MTWHACEPVDETYFDNAPYRHSYPVELDVPPERVWQSLMSDRALADWGLGISLEWTSPRPFGIGTTRSVVLPLHAITVHEQFFRWDDGHRKSFYVTEANRPLLRSFAEDYLVEPTATGSRFTWTVALTPADRAQLLMRVSDPLMNLVYKSVPWRAKAYFAKNP
jgi:hypothetical protein